METEEPNKEIKSKTINQVEESNHQLRIEIAEKCFEQKSSIDFVAKVCSFTKEEATTIYRSYRKRNYILDKEARDSKRDELFKNNKGKKRLSKSELVERKKQKEDERKLGHRNVRQKEADFNRELAAENTRLLLKKIEIEENKEINRRQAQQEQENLRRQSRKEIERRVRNVKKESIKKPSEEPNGLSIEQKMIASVGKCYLRGLNVKQAVLFSKASKEDVERIYKSFKK